MQQTPALTWQLGWGLSRITSTIPMPSVPKKRTKGSSTAVLNQEQVLPHAKIPHADIDWALEQSPTVQRLWLESWRCDSFGSPPTRKKPQWHELKTKLQGSNLRAAMKTLVGSGLFKFNPVRQKTSNGQWKTVGWECLNLHGYYSGFWEIVVDTDKLASDAAKIVDEKDKTADNTDELVDESDNLEPESVATQDLRDSQLLTDYCSTTPPSLTNVMEEESVAITPTATPPQLEAVSPTLCSRDDEVAEEWKNKCREQVEELKRKYPHTKPPDKPSFQSFIS